MPTKVRMVKTSFPRSHVQMWELDHKESWVPKNWWFQIVVLEKTLESPLDCKEIKSVNPKGNQPWIFTGRTDAEAEAPILWPSDVKSQLITKDPDAGKDWRQKEKRAIEDKMVGWHSWCSGHELGQTPGDGEEQGGLACCSPWDLEESIGLGDWTTATRFVIAFVSRSKLILILWLQSPSAVILKLKKIKSATVSTFSPSICHEVMGLDAMILVF